MSPIPGLGTAYKVIRDVGSYASGRLREPVLEVTDTRVVSSAGFDDPVKPSDYQVHVENRGKTTAHDCQARIYFYGTRNFDEGSEGIDAEITVDARTCWARQDFPSSISLHSGDGEWLNVFRLVEDYSAGANFDVDDDRHLEFPTSSGWEENAEIQFRHSDMGVSNTDPRMSRKAVHQTEWKDAFIEITSEEANQRYEVDFDDVNSRIGSSLLFTEDSFTDFSSKWTFDSESE